MELKQLGGIIAEEFIKGKLHTASNSTAGFIFNRARQRINEIQSQGREINEEDIRTFIKELREDIIIEED